MNDENIYYRESLTVWGTTCSIQARGASGIVLHHMDGAPRSSEDGQPYEIPAADAVLIRDVLNAATDRGFLSAEITPSKGDRPVSERPKGAFIEIIEKVQPGRGGDGATIFPTEIRINGTPVLAPAGESVVVHEMSVPSDDLVKVTMTVFARRVTMAQEERP